jgi:spermidine synthase
MNIAIASETATRSNFRKPPLVLLPLFFGSGCAALIYEIVWFQLLQLVIGASAVSLGILLGIFMGGLCLGSLGFSGLISKSRNPLRVYMMLEIGIGLLGIGVLFLVPLAAGIYTGYGGPGFGGFLFRGLICAVCLLPATVLMGATLPALSRCVDTTPWGVSWLGLFYGGNTLGAVAGCLLAGFYLLRVYDMHIAAYFAGALNAVLAGSAFWLSRACRAQLDDGAPCPVPEKYSVRDAERRVEQVCAPASAGLCADPPEEEVASICVGHRAGPGLVYCTIALSGFCALGAEVVWTRLLSLMVGPTVYTFSIILAVFLTGLCLGSGIGSFVARRSLYPERVLGACQLLLGAGIAWTAFLVAKSLPYWPINPSLSRSPWFDFQLDASRCAWAILPAAFLWGASFPLAIAAAAQGGDDPARVVGRIYAANTLGAVLGSLSCSIFLIAWLGTQQVQRILIGLSTASGLMMFLPWAASRNSDCPQSHSESTLIRSATLSGALIATALLMWTLPAVPWELVAHGRYLPSQTILGTELYMGEGMNASVAVTELENGVRNFHISGKVEASTDTRDMRMQRMLGHIPALFHPSPRSVLVVGCGAGITAGSFVVYPSVEKIVICEIEPLVPRVVAQFFGEENYDVLQDPRTQVIYDDARHYILTTKDTFDVITSDPINPWVKGAATLYTKEYFDLCKRHLNPGGLVTQWVPLYQSQRAVVQSELVTFFDVFPQGTIWSNDENGAGYDLVLLGQVGAGKIDPGQVLDRLSTRDYQDVRQSLREVGFHSGFSLLATYAGQAVDLQPWLKHAVVNHDRDLRLEYLAGLSLSHYEQERIYSEILMYRKISEGVFAGRRAQQDMLWQLIEGQQKRK